MRSVVQSSTPLFAVFLLLMASTGLCWKCDKDKSVCEVYLELRHHLTMMKGKSLIVVNDGMLFPYDTANFSQANAVPKEDVITGDGWPEPRVVIAVNKTIPGPVIEVHEHQTVRVRVRNKLKSEAVSVHFHGQLQKGTPWMDGVSFVTQCPFLPGQSFTYQFKAEPAGTFWYHGHTGSQSQMGVNGAFIVHPRNGSSDQYHRQFALMVQDYNHDWGTTMDFLKMEYGMYVNGTKESGSENLSGARYSMFRCQSVLINGRGRYRDPMTGQHNGAPIESFNVKYGNLYRFRIIHSGSVFPLQLSVDGHKLRVVATDGIELKEPVDADSVILTPGERYDFELNATQDVGNYWLKARTLEIGVVHLGKAILHYEGAPEGTDPTSEGRQCTSLDPCQVVNCPFAYFPENANTTCYNVDLLRAAEEMPLDVGIEAVKVKEYFLNFAFPGTTSTPSSVNGIRMTLPPVSALTQPLEFNTRCPGEGYRCVEDELCYCTSVLDLAEGEVVQLVLSNLGVGQGWDHPIHMHGHTFWVLKVGYPNYDNTTGRFLSDNTDIDCRGNADRSKSFCNNATWAKPSWSGNAVPGLELEYPVMKDTVNIPTGGYVVIRIKADNPGLWSFHCHVSLHISDGMFLLLNESYPQHPAPPKGFQTCGDFDVPLPGNTPSGNKGENRPTVDKNSAGSKDVFATVVVLFWCGVLVADISGLMRDWMDL